MKSKNNYANMDLWKGGFGIYSILYGVSQPGQYLYEVKNRVLAERLTRLWIMEGQLQPEQAEKSIKKFSKCTKDILMTMYKNELVLHPELTKVVWYEADDDSVEGITIRDPYVVARRQDGTILPVTIIIKTYKKPKDVEFD